MKLLNLTQHNATNEQKENGVVDLSANDKDVLSKLLTFDNLPTEGEIESRVKMIAKIYDSYKGIDGAMIGGAFWMMTPIIKVIENKGGKCFYAFSKRESVEKTQPDGSVVKQNIFRHCGFIPAK